MSELLCAALNLPSSMTPTDEWCKNGASNSGTRRDDKKGRDIGELANEAVKQIERRRVRPVRVLQQEQSRSVTCLRSYELDQHAHRFFFGKLGRDEYSHRSAPRREATATLR